MRDIIFFEGVQLVFAKILAAQLLRSGVNKTIFLRKFNYWQILAKHINRILELEVAAD